MGPNGTGTLVIIGGAEDKGGQREEAGGPGPAEILEYVAERTGTGMLVVMTCATEEPEDAWQRYREAFAKLGIQRMAHVDVRDRAQGLRDEVSRPIDEADTVFFTGGDQLRITSHIGDTPVYRRIRALLERGGLIAGTSAGASVMSETMLVSGEGEDTPRIEEIARMAPGLGLLDSVIVDMHFAERGRIGRLLGAIAQNPRMLGMGIDENTAAVVHAKCMEVIGSGGVYVLDGARVLSSNVAEASGDETLTIDNVVLHLLNAGRQFDLARRMPA